MSKIWVYVSWNTDHLDLIMDQAELKDDDNTVKLKAQAIEVGNEIFRSWALANDGEIISMIGTEGVLRIGADHLNDLSKLKEQYAETVGSDISIGVGTRLSESKKALTASKYQGGDKITLYTPEVEEIVAQGDQEESSLDKAVREDLTSIGSASPGTSEVSALQNQMEDAGSPASIASPDTSQIRDILGSMADEQSSKDGFAQQDAQKASAKVAGDKDLKSQVLKVLKFWQSRKDELEELSDKDPEMYKALVGMVQSMVKMAQNLFGGEQGLEQAEATMDKTALDPGKTGHHNVTLPVGSQIDAAPNATRKVGRIKVLDPNSGHTKWHQVRANMVTDNDGNPTSSRNVPKPTIQEPPKQ